MKKNEQIEQEEVIKAKLLNEMQIWDAGSDRYSAALSNYSKLIDLDRKRENDKKDRIEKNIHSCIGHVIKIAEIAITVCIYATVCNNGFIIEKDGVIRSNILESMIKDFPKLFKFKNRS